MAREKFQRVAKQLSGKTMLSNNNLQQFTEKAKLLTSNNANNKSDNIHTYNSTSSLSTEDHKEILLENEKLRKQNLELETKLSLLNDHDPFEEYENMSLCTKSTTITSKITTTQQQQLLQQLEEKEKLIQKLHNDIKISTSEYVKCNKEKVDIKSSYEKTLKTLLTDLMNKDMENKSNMEQVKKLKSQLQEKVRDGSKDERIKELQTIVSKSNSDKKDLQTKLKEHEQTILKGIELNNMKDERVKELQTLLSKSNNDKQNLQTKIRKQEQTIKELQSFKSTADSKDERMKELQSIILRYNQDKQALQEKIDKQNCQSKELKSSSQTKNSDDDYYEHRFRTLQKTIKDQDKTINDLNVQLKELKHKQIASSTTTSSKDFDTSDDEYREHCEIKLRKLKDKLKEKERINENLLIEINEYQDTLLMYTSNNKEKIACNDIAASVLKRVVDDRGLHTLNDCDSTTSSNDKEDTMRDGINEGKKEEDVEESKLKEDRIEDIENEEDTKKQELEENGPKEIRKEQMVKKGEERKECNCYEEKKTIQKLKEETLTYMHLLESKLSTLFQHNGIKDIDLHVGSNSNHKDIIYGTLVEDESKAIIADIENKKENESSTTKSTFFEQENLYENNNSKKSEERQQGTSFQNKAAANNDPPQRQEGCCNCYQKHQQYNPQQDTCSIDSRKHNERNTNDESPTQQYTNCPNIQGNTITCNHVVNNIIIQQQPPVQKMDDNKNIFNNKVVSNINQTDNKAMQQQHEMEQVVNENIKNNYVTNPTTISLSEEMDFQDNTQQIHQEPQEQQTTEFNCNNNTIEKENNYCNNLPQSNNTHQYQVPHQGFNEVKRSHQTNNVPEYKLEEPNRFNSSSNSSSQSKSDVILGHENNYQLPIESDINQNNFVNNNIDTINNVSNHPRKLISGQKEECYQVNHNKIAQQHRLHNMMAHYNMTNDQINITANNLNQDSNFINQHHEMQQNHLRDVQRSACNQAKNDESFNQAKRSNMIAQEQQNKKHIKPTQLPLQQMERNMSQTTRMNHGNNANFMKNNSNQTFVQQQQNHHLHQDQHPHNAQQGTNYNNSYPMHSSSYHKQNQVRNADSNNTMKSPSSISSKRRNANEHRNNDKIWRQSAQTFIALSPCLKGKRRPAKKIKNKSQQDHNDCIVDDSTISTKESFWSYSSSSTLDESKSINHSSNNDNVIYINNNGPTTNVFGTNLNNTICDNHKHINNSGYNKSVSFDLENEYIDDNDAKQQYHHYYDTINDKENRTSISNDFISTLSLD